MQEQIEETQIEVPLTEEDKETEVQIPDNKKSEPDVVEVIEAEEPPEESKKDSSEDQNEEHEQYSAKVKKRIDKMTAKLREAERREQAAVEYAQNVQTHLDQERKKASALDNSYLTESEGRIESQLAIVEANLQNAVNNGDGKAAVEAQKVLAQLVYQKEKLENDKKQRKVQQEEKIEKPVTQQPQQQRIDPKARKWAEDNEWFGEDRVMTSGAMEIHSQLSSEGFDLTSNEYYDELNRRIRKEFPHKFKKQADTSNVPSVAPATRSNKTGRTRSIKLTQSEVSIARRLGVPLEEYAKYVRRS